MSKSNFFGPGANDGVEGHANPLDSLLCEAELLRGCVDDSALEALTGARVADLPRRLLVAAEPRRVGGVVGADCQLAGVDQIQVGLSHDVVPPFVVPPSRLLGAAAAARGGERERHSKNRRGRPPHGATLPRGYFSPMRVGRHEVAISNPDKIFFPQPGLTKGDLVQYYLDVADCALPHLRGRPFHMVRYPNGVDSDFFHQKRVPVAPGLRRRAVRAVPERPLDGVRNRQQRGRARLGGQPRLHRAAHVALARARDREAGLPADRPRPDPRRPVAVRPPDRARRARRDGRARPCRRTRRRPVRPGSTSWRRSRRSSTTRMCAGSRRHSPRRSSDESTTRRSRRRRGGSPSARASSSTSARTRATRRSPVRTPSGRRPDARVSTPLLWEEVADVDPGRVHDPDHARPHRGCRRPDVRDVAAETLAWPLFTKLGLDGGKQT